MKPLLLGFLYVASLGLLGLRLAHDTAIVLELYWAVRDHLPRIRTVVPSEPKILSTSFILAKCNSVARGRPFNATVYLSSLGHWYFPVVESKSGNKLRQPLGAISLINERCRPGASATARSMLSFYPPSSHPVPPALSFPAVLSSSGQVGLASFKLYAILTQWLDFRFSQEFGFN
ncbi:hypothetical protein B0H16DRAFT_1702194 [Mycena metata]|uniref:Secreted protein n=1 Tax=Mycena metata TaxID=1033252 RepID=A0AAD7H7R6_9AGAR|nr:hypothetical protein B0H16DRAFT_1702194 [Mycena metata]